MEVVMQMMYSYSLELLAAAVGLMLLLELVTLRKINKWKKKEKEQFSELEEKLSRISEKQNGARARATTALTRRFWAAVSAPPTAWLR